jgi:hypothetical protein
MASEETDMLNLASAVAPSGRRRWISGLLGLSAGLLLIGAAGCGGSGNIEVSKQSRARIVSDADAEGKITIPKSRNPRKPAAGLRTARSIMDKKRDMDQKSD